MTSLAERLYWLQPTPAQPAVTRRGWRWGLLGMALGLSPLAWWPVQPAMVSVPLALPVTANAADVQTMKAPSPYLVHQATWAEHLAEDYRIAPKAATEIVGWAVTAAERHKLDPTLILGIVATESRFNPLAGSSADAVGLMQIRPVAHPEKVARLPLGAQSLLDPALNLWVGAEVLREYLDKFGGREGKALQQYNGNLRDPDMRYAYRVWRAQDGFQADMVAHQRDPVPRVLDEPQVLAASLPVLASREVLPYRGGIPVSAP